MELEALVGHLFVVDGRYINAPSPGAIAVPAPRRAARGRDSDTFFGLLSIGSNERRPASFYDPLIEQVSSVYFHTAGSITAALRKAVSAVNDTLMKGGEADILSVGLVCAILREQELYLAVTGPVRAFLINSDRIERLPSDEELADTRVISMGMEREADVRFYHRQITESDFLVLADNAMNHLNDAPIQYAVESGEVDAALNNMRSVVGDSASAVVIKFVSPLPPDAIEPEPVDMPPPQAPVTPPSMPPATAAQTAAPMQDTAADDEDEQAAPALPINLPFFQRASRDTVQGIAQASERTKTLVEKMLPAEEVDNPLAQRFMLSTTMQIAVAIAVAALVALLTTFVFRFRGQTSQYAQLIREAQGEIETARTAGNDQGTARPHWETAIFLLDQAAGIRAPNREIAGLRQESLQALDSYDHVTRVAPILLREYEPGTYLRGPIIQGLNVYLLDTTNDILYREDIDESGTRLVNREPQIITRQGDLAGDQVVSGLVDLAWMEDGGVPTRNVLALLSRNGLLITYSPSWDVTAALLPGYEAWVDPRAIAVFNRDLYVLDAGANEIWRYVAGTDAYDSTPQRYFTDVIPELGDAVDMQIDTNGNVYVLHASGLISKYAFGQPEPFEYEGLPQPVARPTALYLSLSLFDRAFLIADPGGGRLYTTAVTGAFLANYKDEDNITFDALSGVFTLDQPALIYVTAGNGLYYFPRP